MYRHLNRRAQPQVARYLMGDERMNGATLTALATVGIANRPSMLRAGDHYGFYGKDGALNAVVGFYNNSQCTLYSTHASVAEELAAFISKYPSRTVFGAADSMRPVVESLPKGHLYSPPATQHHMLLGGAQALQNPRPGLEFRNVSRRPNDTAMVVFISRCLKECFGYETRVEIVAKILRERMRQEDYFVALYNGTPIGQVHIQAQTEHYMQIGGVAVMPAMRGRGFGYEIVSFMAKRILGHNHTPTLLVDEDNCAARHVYTGLGFIKTGEMLLLQRP